MYSEIFSAEMLPWWSLTHWGRVTHICVSKLPIIGSDNGLAPGRRQTIIWTNNGLLLIGPLGTNFSEILIGIQTFSFKKMHLKMSSAKWRPVCLGLNVLMGQLNLYTLWLVLSHYNSYETRIFMENYHQTSNLNCTKAQNFNFSHLVLQLSLPNPLKPGV